MFYTQRIRTKNNMLDSTYKVVIEGPAIIVKDNVIIIHGIKCSNHEWSQGRNSSDNMTMIP